MCLGMWWSSPASCPLAAMRWLYRLQQHLSITGTEATALLVLAATLAAGFTVRQLQGQAAPPAAALYAEADARFADADRAAAEAEPASEATGEPIFETRIVPTDSVAIPTSGYADAPRRRTRRSSANDPVRMNLNTADAALLQRLPRIGPALSGRIIAYRENVGPFARVEDIVNVRGIGDKTLEKLRPWLYVE